MTALFLIFAAVLMALGSMLLYLASPNQRLFSAALPCRVLAWSGLLLLVFALVLLLQYSGTGSAVFILMTAVMFVWTVPPMVIAYLHHHRQQKKNGEKTS
ncbi:hypothetical protein PVT68_04610 [Microbulbifer bruguierae]|uniref:Uncharacterized protein n=1 Tax=Microbulbifer bruguierae TaxID=3029061 RepID=A0ABY8NF67_9GAMM|nr:hypothetical protein [Microbulbifer bruguierae]WGL17576.1 hypothetical protein PVT68_04610 [Microbulbifer bruguierae]